MFYPGHHSHLTVKFEWIKKCTFVNRKSSIKNHTIKNLVISILLLCSALLASQSDTIRIRFIANAGLHLSDGNTNIYFDFPYKSGFLMYSKYNKSEIRNIKDSAILIFTHKHPDHYKGSLVRKVKRRKKGRIYGPWNLEKLQKLDSALRDFSIEAISTRHRKSRRHCSYLVTWRNKKIFISGDTESADAIAKMKGLDCAFVPVWILTDARNKKIKIDSKMFGIYHIGIHDRISGTPFAITCTKYLA